MRKYEIMLILPPDAGEDALTRVLDRITQTLRERGGELGSVDRWGRRRLAYELKGLTEGFYLVAEMTADPANIKELDRVLTLMDEVIRFKTVVRAAA